MSGVHNVIHVLGSVLCVPPALWQNEIYMLF
jgi:hypothetical protein